MEAKRIEIADAALRQGAEEGMDGFLQVFIDKYLEVTGGNTIESENVFEKDYSYLSSVSSDKTRGEQVFSKAYLKETLSLFSPFSITSMNDDGSVNTVLAGETYLSGAEFRRKLGIIGSVFTLEETEDSLYVFISNKKLFVTTNNGYRPNSATKLAFLFFLPTYWHSLFSKVFSFGGNSYLCLRKPQGVSSER